MNRLNRAAVLALLVAPLLAGCASDEPAVSLETLSLGIIAGTVTDAALTPLEGAVVRIDGANESATTDASGAFALRVPPGEYLVLASYDAHRGGALRAAPGPGETARLAFTLAALPTERPEVVVAEQHGLISCGATVGLADQETDAACGGSDPNQRTSLRFGIDATHGLSGAVIEVAWEPSTEAAGRLRVLVSTGEGEAATLLAASEGDGHVLISLPARVLEGALAPGATLDIQVAPTGSLTDEEAGIDAGAAFQQPFAAYLSMFYHQAQPTGYSVLQASS